MKRKNITLSIILFVLISVIILIKILFIAPSSSNSLPNIKSQFQVLDIENRFKMILPDSFIKSQDEIKIEEVSCIATKYICNTSNANQISITIIEMPARINDTSVRKIIHNYFGIIENGTVFKAGKLEGIKWKSNICGVPIEFFLGVDSNKIYHYSETLVGDSTILSNSHIDNLKIDMQGQNIKTFITKIQDASDSKITQIDSQQKKDGFAKNASVENLISEKIDSEDLNTIRIDIPLKKFQANPDTVLYFVKQHYYAMEHTFQRSIACNFKNGTSVERIVYPIIDFTINLYESSGNVKVYQVIHRSYVGNANKK